MVEFTGKHTHATLGTVDYAAKYTARKPHSTWLVLWNATAVVSGREVKFSSNMEILVGSSGAARILIEKAIHTEIDKLTQDDFVEPKSPD